MAVFTRTQDQAQAQDPNQAQAQVQHPNQTPTAAKEEQA